MGWAIALLILASVLVSVWQTRLARQEREDCIRNGNFNCRIVAVRGTMGVSHPRVVHDHKDMINPRKRWRGCVCIDPGSCMGEAGFSVCRTKVLIKNKEEIKMLSKQFSGKKLK